MIEYTIEGYVPTFRLLLQKEGSVIPRALLSSLPSGCAAVIIILMGDGVNEKTGTDSLNASQLWAAMAAVLMFMVGFRTNKAYSRFWDGTTLLHQMWGEWFDAVSCLVAFSSTAKKSKPVEVADFRHTLIRLMSLLHGSALEEIGQVADDPEGYPIIDLGGLDQTTLQYLKDCKFEKHMNFNRVEVLIHMIQTLVVSAQESGVLKIPPPIISRVFQTLSRGQVNLANCKKITFTLFPFPYAQLISCLLIVFSVATPCIMASILDHPILAFWCSLIPVFGVWSLNYVAQELEIPFGDDENDLPMLDFQHHMNTSMLMLCRKEVDIVPVTSSVCDMDYDSMMQKISTKRPLHFLSDGPRPSFLLSEPKDDAGLGKPSAPASGQGAGTEPARPPPAAQNLLDHLPPPAASVTLDIAPVALVPEAPPLASVAGSPKAPDLQEKAVVQASVVSAVSTALPKGPDVELLEQALKKRIEDLCAKLEDLMSNAGGLSEQLGKSTGAFQKSTGAFQDFTMHTTILSNQLGNTTGAILELTKETDLARKKMSLAGGQWEVPVFPERVDFQTGQRRPVAEGGTRSLEGVIPLFEGGCPAPPREAIERLPCCLGNNPRQNSVRIPAAAP